MATRLVRASVVVLLMAATAVPAGAGHAGRPHTILMSRTSSGPKADGDSIDPSISANGRFIAFESRADNLPGGDGTTTHIYRHGPL